MIQRAIQPKYLGVYTYLRFLLQRDELKKGDPLPTEFSLCRKFQCSRRTIRKAIGLLVTEGKVEPRQGSGTYVREPLVGTRVPGLSLGTGDLFAAIVPNVFTSEIARFVRTLFTVCRGRGSSLVLGVTNEIPEMEREFIEEIARLRVNGVFKFPTNPEFEEERRERLRFYGIPFIAVNDFWTSCRKDHHVIYDDCAAAEIAVEHLVKLGHRSIVLLESQGWPRVRAAEAFLKSLEQRNLPCDKTHVLLYDMNKPVRLEKLYEDKSPHPTAFVTVYDLVAVPLIEKLKEVNLRVPKDVSVVNLGGMLLDPPAGLDLTATVIPDREMAEEAFRILAARPKQGHVHHHVYLPELHVGNTSGPCRKGGITQHTPRYQKRPSASAVT